MLIGDQDFNGWLATKVTVTKLVRSQGKVWAKNDAGKKASIGMLHVAESCNFFPATEVLYLGGTCPNHESKICDSNVLHSYGTSIIFTSGATINGE